jgi:hypothetical protein
MAIQNKIAGGISNTLADVDAGNNLKVTLPTDHLYMGGALQFNENDSGEITGQKFFFSPEVDTDYRQRVSQDLILDEEVFNYITQNTGKYKHTATTMASAWTAGQFTTNSSNITTINTGVELATYATFPNTGTQTLSADMVVGFSNQPTANTFVEFGFGLAVGAVVSAVTDGCFFRLNSAGLQGIVVNSTTETSTGVFPATDGAGIWTYENNKKYQFICYLGGVSAYFWVNDGTGAKLLGSVPLPSGQGRLVMSAGLPLIFKHRIVGGAAGAVFQAQLGAYNVRLGGSNVTSTLSTQGNRIYGSYQGQAGGTQGSLASYANSANPTAAVPTNTTAALGTGLGGQFWETATLAVNTDGIICSYQVPVLSVNGTSKRLVIRGVALSSFVQTAITGAPFIAQYSLAFGHTAVSLATAEGVGTKMPRRIALPFHQSITAAQAASTLVTQNEIFCDFGDAPIYVNAGEFVALVTKHVGTAATAGVIAHTVTFIYGWE